jgi:hypothetical protein
VEQNGTECYRINILGGETGELIHIILNIPSPAALAEH